MPDRELLITIKLAKGAAERMAQQFHEGERRRIRQTADEQAKADRDYVKSVKKKLQAGKQLEESARKTAKDDQKQTKDSEEAYVRAMKRKLAAQKQLEKAEEGRRKADERDQAKADKAYERAVKRKLAAEKALEQEKKRLAERSEREHEALIKRQQRRMEQLDRAAKKVAQDEQKETRKSEDAYVRAMRRKLAAQKQLERAEEQRAKKDQGDQDKADKAYERAMRHKLAAQKQLDREIEKRSRQHQSDQEKSDKDYERAVRRKVAAEKQLEREAEKVAKGKQADQDKSDRDYERAMRKKIAAEKRLEQAEVDRVRREQREQEKADEAYVRAVKKKMRAVAQMEKEAQKRQVSALAEQQQRILSISQAYTAMRAAALVGQGIRQGISAYGDSLRQSRDFIEDMVRSTEQLRDAMAETLALQGKPISSASTAEELGEFANLGLTPQQGISAQNAFRQNAQGMVGAGQAYRITEGQAKELSGFAAKVAASQGMDVAPAEELMSTLIAKAPIAMNGKVGTQAIKEQFARNMGLFRNARGSTALDVRQATEAIQKNAKTAADIDEYAIMAAAQAEVQPGKVRVNLDALVRGLDQLDEEKRDRLGIRLGMSDQQKLAAATESIPRIAKEEFGGDERTAARTLAFNQQHELDAFMAHLNRGIRGGIYAKVRAEQRAGSAAKSEAEHAAFMRSEGGVAGRQASDLARTDAMMAAKFRPLTELRRESAIEVKMAGELMEPEGFISAIGTAKAQQLLGTGDRFAVQTEKLGVGKINAGLRQFADGREWIRANGELSDMSPDPKKLEALTLWNKLKAGWRGAAGIYEAARQQAHEQLVRGGELRGAGGGSLPAGEVQRRIESRTNAMLVNRFPKGHPATRPGQVNARRRVFLGNQDTGLDVGSGTRPETPEEHSRRMAETLDGMEDAGQVPPQRRPLRVVLPPGIAGREAGAHRRRAARHHGHHVVLPGADGRLRHARRGRIPSDHHSLVAAGLIPILTDAERLAHQRMAVRPRLPAPGDTSAMGRVGAGIGYSAGMFAMDPAHAAAQAENARRADQHRQFMGDRYAAMPHGGPVGVGGGAIAKEIRDGLRTQVPAPMPSRPFVMGR